MSTVSFFGLGKLGLPLAAVFASRGVKVIGIDIDAGLVSRLEAGETPYTEPGLSELLRKAAPNITYTADPSAAADTDVSIVLVPTPSTPEKPEFSLDHVIDACRALSRALQTRPRARYHLIVVSSTVAPGSIAKKIAPALEEALGQRAGRDFGLAYVPDFVALGEIVAALPHPPFLLVGSDDPEAGSRALSLFRRIVAPDVPIRLTSSMDAELIKVVHNVFCTMKVSFGNFLAQLGERLGGINLDIIAATLGLAPKIGTGYLEAGGPYGGPCLPRDTEYFLHFAASVGLDAPLVRASEAINAAQFDLIERSVLVSRPRSVAVLGLAFKAGTPVTIGSPAFVIIERLLARSVRVLAYDPLSQAREQARLTFGQTITCCETIAEAVSGAEAVLIINNDQAFAGVGRDIPADRTVIDPWGTITDAHPNLLRPGWSPLTPRPSRTSEPATPELASSK